MQLTLLAAPSETILAELYGWGELPIEWIGERSAEFNNAAASLPNGPICMQSSFKCKPSDCSFSHIYVYPIDPHPDQAAVVKQQRLQMESDINAVNRFRLHHIHDGVECFAFM